MRKPQVQPVYSASIIDNIGDNLMLSKVVEMAQGADNLDIATCFFTVAGLSRILSSDNLNPETRLLFGSDAGKSDRMALLAKLQEDSDQELLVIRPGQARLTRLGPVCEAIKAGRFKAKVYTESRFHAKAYSMTHPTYPYVRGVLGSSNCTSSGLSANIELNVKLNDDQALHLRQWFQDRWDEAEEDIAQDVLEQIMRQIDLYDPYVIFLKALLEWGLSVQGADTPPESRLQQELDPHQYYAYLRALKIIDRQHGVMVCDGVGLGKSYVALALAEHYLRLGFRVALIAPKSIVDNSWNSYTSEWLARYKGALNSLAVLSMSDLSVDLNLDEDTERIVNAKSLVNNADVVIVDESHNFRTRSAQRYKTLFEIVSPIERGRKRVVLLTATPLNTAYEDVASQLSLITHEHGSIEARSWKLIRDTAKQMDKSAKNQSANPNRNLFEGLDESDREDLWADVLEQTVIQRSRNTCRDLAEAQGRHLVFPKRREPEPIAYELHQGYAEVAAETQRLFDPAVTHNKEIKKILDDPKLDEGKRIEKLSKLKQSKGIKLAGFLLEQYLKVPRPGVKQYQTEIRLSKLVLANVLKQLESSAEAFQGILQSIGTGLVGRLDHVFGEEVDADLIEHRDWIRQPISGVEASKDATYDDLDDLENLDVSGAEFDSWLEAQFGKRQLERKLKDLKDKPEDYDLAKWRKDLLDDLRLLKVLVAATVSARTEPDRKLEALIAKLLELHEEGRRILIFTQSVRTARYLERELKSRVPELELYQIDASVQGDQRSTALHNFCPLYNRAPAKPSPSVPRNLDILITTDVLSEGVNLQEAGAIVNYDIHWNPVRLIQRIGRVDRRLDPKIDPNTDRDFRILNVIPPKAIDNIINLVGTVENRLVKISRTLGLEFSTYSSSDVAGNLKEFNHEIEGSKSVFDEAVELFVRKQRELDQDSALSRLVQRVPPGGFGVWGQAPFNGLFVMWRLVTRDRPTLGSSKWGPIVGRNLLCLWNADTAGVTMDAETTLSILSKAEPGVRSADPSSDHDISAEYEKLHEHVTDRLVQSLGLPTTIELELVVWMELKRSDA